VYVFVAATARSGPASRSTTCFAAAASGEATSFVSATVGAPCPDANDPGTGPTGRADGAARRPPDTIAAMTNASPPTGARIDLNADVGESFGPWPMGDDEALIPLVSSVNVACGLHAGDPLGIARTVERAVAAGVAIGAHPGYPDLVGFGRRDLAIDLDELEATIVYQVGAVAALAGAAGADLRHVKPHGALYNRAARDAGTAEAVARAVRSVSSDLVLVGLAGSLSLEAGRSAGLAVAAEAFADRAYEADGSLRARRHADALIPDPGQAADRAVRIAVHGEVEALDGSVLRLSADTVCVHGDTPGAAAIARAVRSRLESAGVRLAPPPHR